MVRRGGAMGAKPDCMLDFMSSRLRARCQRSIQKSVEGAVFANGGILYVGAMAGSGQRSKSEKTRPTNQTQSGNTIRVPDGSSEERKKTRGSIPTALHFLELSLGVSHGLKKMI